ncbi:Ig-like domain-containing protein [Tenacibaculum sp. TC6]|uniref:Ig-like domain-containing protein n=1 Tax=Tenacibaculum sp. TC6 TaxID=3423223 RepID=UPI003D363B72
MKKITQISVFFLVILVIGCARRGRPDGGPKDEKAPIMVTANPPYETTNFTKNTIKIHFDEYIVLKDLTKQLVVSPPLKNPLVISPQGSPSKNITIKILDTLKPNTTYTFNFGNAVQDNNEGNKLESFKYVFSTGKTIDSLKIKGSITNAFKKVADKNISVLLYKLDSTFNDSIIYKKKPEYVTNTLDSTGFQFTNIKEGKYLLLALKEPANDYLFSPRTDQIGFLADTIVLPRDSIVKKEVRLFKEKQPFQLKRPKEVSKGKIEFGFEGGKKDLEIKLLSKVPNDFNSFSQYEKEKDTLLFWHTPTELDSLNFLVTKNTFIDTVTVHLRKKQIDSLVVNSNVKSILNLKDTFFLETNNPIIAIDTAKVSLVDKDTLKVSHKVEKFGINKLAVLFDKKPKMGYELKVLPDAIVDIYQTKNDSLKYRFGTKEIEDYGTIILEVENKVKKPLIIELLEKDNVLLRKYIKTSEKITFDLLEPKEYLIRAIIDENDNKSWDTGSFLKRIQPEKVIYFPQVFKLRANWIQNERFVIEE